MLINKVLTGLLVDDVDDILDFEDHVISNKIDVSDSINKNLITGMINISIEKNILLLDIAGLFTK